MPNKYRTARARRIGPMAMRGDPPAASEGLLASSAGTPAYGTVGAPASGAPGVRAAAGYRPASESGARPRERSEFREFEKRKREDL